MFAVLKFFNVDEARFELALSVLQTDALPLELFVLLAETE
jgi:hypothetical protein